MPTALAYVVIVKTDNQQGEAQWCKSQWKVKCKVALVFLGSTPSTTPTTTIALAHLIPGHQGPQHI